MMVRGVKKPSLLCGLVNLVLVIFPNIVNLLVMYDTNGLGTRIYPG